MGMTTEEALIASMGQEPAVENPSRPKMTVDNAIRAAKESYIKPGRSTSLVDDSIANAKSFGRGLTVGTGGSIAELAGHGIDAIEGVASKTLGIDTGIDFSGDMGARARASIDSAVGIPEPTTSGGKIAEAAGEGLGFGALTAPLVASGAGVPMALAEMGLSTAGAAMGEMSRQGAENAGGGAIAQGGASVVGDLITAVAAPWAVVARAPKTIDKMKQIMLAAESSPQVKKAAADIGVSVRDLVRGSSEWKTLFPKSPYGDERYIDEAAQALEDVSERFTKETMPTTRQALETEFGDAGAGLAGMEEQAGRLTNAFGPIVAGRRKAARDALSSELESIRPDGSVEVLSDAYTVARDMRAKGVSDLWAKVDAVEMPNVDTSRLKAAAMESKRRAGEFDQDIPDEVLKVLDWPESVPWEQFQKMRSRIERTDRIAGKSLGETAAKHKAANLKNTKHAFSAELDVIAKNDPSGEYKNALAATRKFETDFNRTRPSIKAIEGFEDGARMAKRVLGSPKPAEEAGNVMRIMEATEGGVDSFRRILFDEVAGGEMNPGRAKTILKKLRDNDKAMIEVFGQESFDNMLSIHEKARTISVGKTGSSSQAMSVGSGQTSALEIGMASADAFNRPAGMAASVVRKAMGKVLNNDVAMQRVFYEAALDPKLAAVLLRMPTDRALPAWVVGWDKLTKRALARTVTRNQTGETADGVR